MRSAEHEWRLGVAQAAAKRQGLSTVEDKATRRQRQQQQGSSPQTAVLNLLFVLHHSGKRCHTMLIIVMMSQPFALEQQRQVHRSVDLLLRYGPRQKGNARKFCEAGGRGWARLRTGAL